MNFSKPVLDYINNPFPLWENKATGIVIQKKWEELKLLGIKDTSDYAVEKCLLNSFEIPKSEISKIKIADRIILVPTDTSIMNEFYDEHGLNSLPINEILSSNASAKVENALRVLDLVGGLTLFIDSIIESIHFVKSENVEIDISYSHPLIPFSIFISLCEDESLRSNIRVAESILHEAMHLKLTLIENVIPLVKPCTGSLFYSPWRDENRPAKGVLHGLFVFTAVLDFFREMQNNKEVEQEKKYIQSRINQISWEINQLTDFALCSDLTKDGATLTANLLPLN